MQDIRKKLIVFNLIFLRFNVEYSAFPRVSDRDSNLKEPLIQGKGFNEKSLTHEAIGALIFYNLQIIKSKYIFKRESQNIFHQDM